MFQNLVDSTLARQGLSRRIIASISHFTVMPFIVAKSDAIAMFPRRLAQSFAALTDLVVLEPPVDFEGFNISMAWHPRVHHDPGHRWLRSLFIRAIGRFTSGDRPASAAG
jgi:DNA-binding transcriptional LysR family regulator